MPDNPSFVVYDGNGSQTDFVYPFTAIDDDYIFAEVGGVEVAFTIPSAGTVRISPAPASGTDNVRIYRQTPAEEPDTTFADGATILGANLNRALEQPLDVAQEARDLAVEAKGLAASGGPHTHAMSDVTGLAAALAAKAASSHAHTVADITATGTPDNTKYLRGDGAWVTPPSGGEGGGGGDMLASNNLADLDNFATARTNLGLGTAAVAASGDFAAASHNHNASAINAGTLSNDRLPARLGVLGQTVTDWNDATASGWYFGANASNAPTSGSGHDYFGHVQGSADGQWATQLAHLFPTDSESDTGSYRREKNSGTWGSWYRVRLSQAEMDARYMLLSRLASVSEYRSATADKVLEADTVWDAADDVALTDASTIAINFASGFNFTVTIAGNRTLGNPSNKKMGQSGIIEITQDGTGSRTLAFASDWAFANGAAPDIASGAGERSVLSYTVLSDGKVLGSLLRDVS